MQRITSFNHSDLRNITSIDAIGMGINMIILLEKNADKNKVSILKDKLKQEGLDLYESIGISETIIGLIGNTNGVDKERLKANEVVADVKRISEPYKRVNRKMHQADTVVNIKGHKIGGGHFQVIAGPCSIETQEQMNETASAVKKHGAGLLRGGAFKPRTSPYSFQGLENHGLSLLLEAAKKTNMPVVTELMSPKHLELFQDVDVIQIGARNMQNFDLLKEVGKTDKTILLKRGLANTIEELLMSAEYIMAGGNENIILCERGIRTFETSVRNTMDISAIPLIKKYSHLPIIVDPSHAAGINWMVEPLALAAVAAGADGLMIEVHNNPQEALCDGAQSLKPQEFRSLMQKVNNIRPKEINTEKADKRSA